MKTGKRPFTGSFLGRNRKRKKQIKISCSKRFDCDRITDNVVIRTRAEGDYLTIDAAGNHKSIQDYFVDEKIPRHKRDQIILVCDGSHVMWVVGYRISEYYKISNNTTRVLEIVYGGTGNE